MLAAALAGCAGAPQTAALHAISANIRVTSSDANDAAAWLTERLGDALTDRVVLGTDADGYGVDVSALEDDGYFIRSLGGEVALFARTTDGLDRAVRKYAKAVEAGEPIADETYHEGYRVEELRLAGVPVAEYAIAVEGESEYVRGWVTENAAKPFAALVKIACGAELPVGGEAEHKIVFRQIADESFKESSFHYYFTGGDLVFEYVDLGGARNAFAKFLENECGWEDLYYGADVLHEADLIDVPKAADVLCHPAFGGMRHTSFRGGLPENTFKNVSGTSFWYPYRIGSAGHYLGCVWGKDYGYETTGSMPCMTDEYVLEDVTDEIAEHVRGRLDAGEVIGESLTKIDIGIEDAGQFWCRCKECAKTYKAEGYTWAGPMIYFANNLDARLDALGYDGLKFTVFAYADSNIPPKTAPSDDIYITFVFDNSCTIHCLDGSQCEEKSFPVTVDGSGMSTTRKFRTHMGDMLRGWCAISDHVYARPAQLIAPPSGIALIEQTYDDVKFLVGLGVECVYDEMYTNEGCDTSIIATELWESLMFDPDLTRAEYYEEVARQFEKYFGDGWRGALDYVECLETAEIESRRCWSVWSNYVFPSDPGTFDHATYRALWDRMLDSLAEAERGADSREQEIAVKKLRIAALYGGCYASYYVAYQEADDARLALLCELWAELVSITREIGVHDDFMSGRNLALKLTPELLPDDGDLLFDSLEETAWRGWWRNDYNTVMYYNGYGVSELRPAP